jgi:RNA polymerase sigma-70 factor (ECF subfamily)
MRAVTVPDLRTHPLAAMPDTPSADPVPALLAAIRAGDEAAFGEFHARYATRLYRYVLVLARGDVAEARETAQTVWVKVATHCAQCADERALWAWLTRVARNAFIDQCRARATRERRIVPIDEDASTHAAAADLDTALRAALRQILDTLPPGERELLHAAYVDEQPLGELAAAEGTTYKALESRLGRLRARLRALLLNTLRHESD